MTRLTPDQAHYVLTTLLAQRKLRQAQVDKALAQPGQRDPLPA